MKRSGVADLPLHGGRVPPWLATPHGDARHRHRRERAHHYGRPALLSRLSDPFWFQALGSVMGMDWHSSGITTSVMGALKKGLNPRAHELGIYICGGRGRHSRNTPDELRTIADRTGLDGDALVRTSRLTARVDNNAIADGFQIYLHSFVLTADGEWAVVQQGMNEASAARAALSLALGGGRATSPPIRTPPSSAQHAGTIRTWSIAGRGRRRTRCSTIAREDPADDAGRGAPPRDAGASRRARAPTSTRSGWAPCWRSRTSATCATSRRSCCSSSSARARCSRWRSSPKSCTARRRASTIRRASRSRTAARTAIRSRCRCSVYDESIAVLRRALDAARLGHTDKLDGIARLDAFTRAIERQRHPQADVDAAIAHERAMSPSLGGRTVFDDLRERRKPKGGPHQPGLFDG